MASHNGRQRIGENDADDREQRHLQKRGGTGLETRLPLRASPNRSTSERRDHAHRHERPQHIDLETKAVARDQAGTGHRGDEPPGNKVARPLYGKLCHPALNAETAGECLTC
jgi:hypothetical protein